MDYIINPLFSTKATEKIICFNAKDEHRHQM